MGRKRTLSEVQLLLDGQDFFKQFIFDLRYDVRSLGGDDMALYNAMKSDSTLRREFAKLIVGAPKLALRYLKLIADNIAIVTQPFKKDSFFTENGPVELYFWENFKDWILKAIPDEIPAFEGTLRQTELTKDMDDSEILNELNNPKPFTLPEFAAIIRDLLTEQPNGESGTLLTNGYANIFYVQFADGTVVAVVADWLAVDRGWRLLVFSVDAYRWVVGHRVFSRS